MHVALLVHIIKRQTPDPSTNYPIRKPGKLLPGCQPVGGTRSFPVQERNALELDVDIIEALKQKILITFAIYEFYTSKQCCCLCGILTHLMLPDI